VNTLGNYSKAISVWLILSVAEFCKGQYKTHQVEVYFSVSMHNELQEQAKKLFVHSSKCSLRNTYLCKMMESKRQKQVGELLRRYFSMILMEEGSNIYGRDKLVTVANVRMTPDLLMANIYISVYGTELKQEVILEIEDNYQRLHQALIKKIGKQMRRMPELVFHLDDTVDEMYRVAHLLDGLESNKSEL
jgi:ribosome-binding factor A